MSQFSAKHAPLSRPCPLGSSPDVMNKLWAPSAKETRGPRMTVWQKRSLLHDLVYPQALDVIS